jgi:hypothetical protein
MDPRETLLELLGALTCNDTETAADAASDLADWLRKGGFSPAVIARPDVRRQRDVTLPREVGDVFEILPVS